MQARHIFGGRCAALPHGSHPLGAFKHDDVAGVSRQILISQGEKSKHLHLVVSGEVPVEFDPMPLSVGPHFPR